MNHSDSAGDIAGDNAGDITWLSYAELGQARGISAASAKRLAIRRHWRRRPGNDGTTRVAVPMAEAAPREDKAGDGPGDNTGDVTRLVAALEAAIAASGERAQTDAAMLATLQNLLDQANSRADKAEASADTILDAFSRASSDIQAQLEQARTDVQAADQRAEASEQARATAERAHAEAAVSVVALSEQLEAFEAEAAARQARGVLARLRAAWRGG
jgi:hypothetical protein